MTAAIFQRGGLAAAVAEQHHLLVEKGSPDRLCLQIIRPERGVPAIAQEHEWPPTSGPRPLSTKRQCPTYGMLDQIYKDCRRRVAQACAKYGITSRANRRIDASASARPIMPKFTCSEADSKPPTLR